MFTKKRLLLRSISTSLVLAFVCGDLRAAPLDTPAALSPQQILLQDPRAFETPVQYVSLSEVRAGTNGTFIIHIQDAHSNFSGQENLANALQELMRKYDVRLVLSEGGWATAH